MRISFLFSLSLSLFILSMKYYKVLRYEQVGCTVES